jgi:hypothetical protein
MEIVKGTILSNIQAVQEHETALSRGELYTILSNKEAHGGKGTIVAIVKGTKIEDVVNVLKALPTEKRLSVEEKTDKRGRKPNRKNEAYQPERLENGDTLVELITRSRYLLMTSAENWTDSQKLRAKLLFKRFPEMGLSDGEEIVTEGTFSVDAAAQLEGKESMMNQGL